MFSIAFSGNKYYFHFLIIKHNTFAFLINNILSLQKVITMNWSLTEINEDYIPEVVFERTLYNLL